MIVSLTGNIDINKMSDISRYFSKETNKVKPRLIKSGF